MTTYQYYNMTAKYCGRIKMYKETKVQKFRQNKNLGG